MSEKVNKCQSTNSIRTCLWGFSLLCFFPFIPLYIRLIILCIFILIYGYSIVIVFLFTVGVILLIITRKPSIYRALSSLLVYHYLDCDTIIQEPSNPTIFIANYPASILNYFVPGIFPKNICLIAGYKIGRKFIPIAFPEDQIIYVHEQEHNYDLVKKQIKSKLQQGYCIFAYADNAKIRKDETDIKEWRKGMFVISKELRVSLTPVVVERITLGPLGQIKQKKMRIQIGKPHIVKNIKTSMDTMKSYFQQALKNMRDTEMNL